MDEELLEDIYCTLYGMYIPEAMVPGVPNLFADGCFCMNEYIRMRAAYDRICLRLGLDPDYGDADLEEILDAMENMQKTMSKEMFRLGRILEI